MILAPFLASTNRRTNLLIDAFKFFFDLLMWMLSTPEKIVFLILIGIGFWLLFGVNQSKT
jgi:hypothetical protein